MTEFLSLIGIESPEYLLLLLIPFPLILLLLETNIFNKRSGEFTRKIAHIVSGAVILLAFSLLSYTELIIFLITLTGAALIARYVHFDELYAIRRASMGVILFPLGILLTVLLFGTSNLTALYFALLILIVSDSLAAIIGGKWGRRQAFFDKSLLGSLVFFLSSFVIAIIFIQNIWTAFFAAVLLTIMEYISVKGIDNVTIPISAVFLFLVL